MQSVGNSSVIFSAHSTRHTPSPERSSRIPISSASRAPKGGRRRCGYGTGPSYSVTIVKVGLTIGRAGSQRLPTPLQKSVFPAPRSPVSATTSPGRRAAPNARAIAKVSSGESEVNWRSFFHTREAAKKAHPAPYEMRSRGTRSVRLEGHGTGGPTESPQEGGRPAPVRNALPGYPL